MARFRPRLPLIKQRPGWYRIDHPQKGWLHLIQVDHCTWVAVKNYTTARRILYGSPLKEEEILRTHSTLRALRDCLEKNPF